MCAVLLQASVEPQQEQLCASWQRANKCMPNALVHLNRLWKSGREGGGILRELGFWLCFVIWDGDFFSPHGELSKLKNWWKALAPWLNLGIFQCAVERFVFDSAQPSLGIDLFLFPKKKSETLRIQQFADGFIAVVFNPVFQSYISDNSFILRWKQFKLHLATCKHPVGPWGQQLSAQGLAQTGFHPFLCGELLSN